MSKIAQFLESLGASPNQLSGTNYASSVESAGLGVASRDVLLVRDHDGLNGLLGGRAAMRRFVAVPD
jgi:hypothetical protein